MCYLQFNHPFTTLIWMWLTPKWIIIAQIFGFDIFGGKWNIIKYSNRKHFPKAHFEIETIFLVKRMKHLVNLQRQRNYRHIHRQQNVTSVWLKTDINVWLSTLKLRLHVLLISTNVKHFIVYRRWIRYMISSPPKIVSFDFR